MLNFTQVVKFNLLMDHIIWQSLIFALLSLCPLLLRRIKLIEGGKRGLRNLSSNFERYTYKYNVRKKKKKKTASVKLRNKTVHRAQ